MKSLDEQLAFYAEHHTKPITQYTHMVGVPMIILGLLVFFSWIRLDFFSTLQISLAWLLILATLIYYLLLNKKIAGIMAVIFIPLTLIATWWTGPRPTSASFIAFLVLFVGGWIVQFIGHGFEKKKPAFFSALIQTLIAPIFILIEICALCGVTLYPMPSSQNSHDS